MVIIMHVGVLYRIFDEEGAAKQKSKAISVQFKYMDLTSVTRRRSAVKAFLLLSSVRKQPTEGLKVNTPGMDTSIMPISNMVHTVDN